MSAEEEKDVKGEAPAESAVAKKRGLAKRIGKRDSAKKESAQPQAADDEPAAKDAAAKEPVAKESAAKEPAAPEAKEPAAPEAKEPAAKKPAAGQPAGDKTPAKRSPGGVVAPKEPAARPARAGRSGTGPPARRRVVRARARYVRTSARKARMVCGHLRGKSVQEARAILAFTPRDVARDWSKLLESAVANAETNHELLEDDLIVREAYADEGPTIKRFRPRAMGRATPIRKRTSHLTITLTPGP